MSFEKSGADFVQALRHLVTAQEYFESIMRDHPGAPLSSYIKRWHAKLRWILFDVSTTPLFDREVVEAIRAEVKSDPFVFSAIQEKIALMSPEERLKLEEIAELISSGVSLEITPINP